MSASTTKRGDGEGPRGYLCIRRHAEVARVSTELQYIGVSILPNLPQSLLLVAVQKRD